MNIFQEWQPNNIYCNVAVAMIGSAAVGAAGTAYAANQASSAQQKAAARATAIQLAQAEKATGYATTAAGQSTDIQAKGLERSVDEQRRALGSATNTQTGAFDVAAAIQSGALDRATAIQLGLVGGANELLGNTYGGIRADFQPYMNVGTAGAEQLNNRLPFLTTPIAMSPEMLALQNPLSIDQATLENLPGYQFTKTQGLKAAQNSAAARGLGVSGAALKGAATFATGLADSTYANQFNLEMANRQNAYGRFNTTYQNQLLGQSNEFNRLKALIDAGQAATGATSTFGGQLGGLAATNLTNAGANLASNTVATGANIGGQSVTTGANIGAQDILTGNQIGKTVTDVSRGIGGTLTDTAKNIGGFLTNFGAQAGSNTIGSGNAQAAGINSMGNAVATGANNIGGYMAYRGLYGTNPGGSSNQGSYYDFTKLPDNFSSFG